MMKECPVCDNELELEDTAEEGVEVDCDDCGSTLRLVGTNLVDVDELDREEDEDDEDEEDEDYEDEEETQD